jgi:hypothetical protein
VVLDEAEIAQRMSGNLRPCAPYANMIAATAEVAGRMRPFGYQRPGDVALAVAMLAEAPNDHAELWSHDERRQVPIRTTGAPVDRLDGREKVTGTAPYAFEQPVDRPGYP